jgi:hypothetical protein
MSFYQTSQWIELRYKILRKYGFTCQACGSPAEPGNPVHVDHIKPRSKYPELELCEDNLQVLCKACNLGKSNRYEDRFIQRDISFTEIDFDAAIRARDFAADIAKSFTDKALLAAALIHHLKTNRDLLISSRGFAVFTSAYSMIRGTEWESALSDKGRESKSFPALMDAAHKLDQFTIDQVNVCFDTLTTEEPRVG